MKKILWMILVALFLVPSLASAAQTTLYTNADTDITTQSMNSNFGSQVDLYVLKENFGYTTSFLNFDLSSLPSGSKINSAALSGDISYCSGDPGGATFKVALVTQDWTESGLTYANQPQTIGAFVDNISLPCSKDQYVSMDVTPLISGVVLGNYSWHGLQIYNDSNNLFTWGFYSRENGQAKTAKLILNYTPPGGDPTATATATQTNSNDSVSSSKTSNDSSATASASKAASVTQSTSPIPGKVVSAVAISSPDSSPAASPNKKVSILEIILFSIGGLAILAVVIYLILRDIKKHKQKSKN